MSGENNDREPLHVAIVNKSDATGGAAVVSRRLMEAMRGEGIDARMLVVEKLSGSPYVEVAASPGKAGRKFIKERLKIFVRNGFNRRTLFKIDTSTDGLPLWGHPLIKKADVVLLNWINQGMLSLAGIRKILSLGKPVIWTMHDMWCMTGICHHAGKCEGYLDECGHCPLLGIFKGSHDISYKVWHKKSKLSDIGNKITYVAVSNWLADKAIESSLLCRERVVVIPNAFPAIEMPMRRPRKDKGVTILFGAARVDDPIKGLPVVVEMTGVLRRKYPELADRLNLVTFGGVKNKTTLEGMAIPHRHLGVLRGEDKIRNVYESADILVSASSYETLPGTLVEAQAYGCIPVSFDRGGQPDIVEHLSTGYLAEYSDSVSVAASRLAEGVAWALSIIDNPEGLKATLRAMSENVTKKFAYPAVARSYKRLMLSMMQKDKM